MRMMVAIFAKRYERGRWRSLYCAAAPGDSPVGYGPTAAAAEAECQMIEMGRASQNQGLTTLLFGDHKGRC